MKQHVLLLLPKDAFGSGFAEEPCRGAHVKSTKEVGFVNLKRSRSGKGIERIAIKLIDENQLPTQ